MQNNTWFGLIGFDMEMGSLRVGRNLAPSGLKSDLILKRQGSMTFLSKTCSIKLIIFFSTASEEFTVSLWRNRVHTKPRTKEMEGICALPKNMAAPQDHRELEFCFGEYTIKSGNSR